MTDAAHHAPLGTTMTTAAVTVTESHLVAWAGLTGDWLPLHMDEEFARRTQLGSRLVHGPFTLALALGLSTQTAGLFDPRATLAWLGLNEVRALSPVRIGDTVRAEVTVADVRPSSKKPDREVLSLAYRVVNQHGEGVLTFVNVLMVKRHDVSAESGAAARSAKPPQ